jgi:hypothetical protein
MTGEKGENARENAALHNALFTFLTFAVPFSN